MSTSPLSPVIAYLEKNRHEFGLSVDKVLKRAEKIQVDDNGIVSFEMERHSGVGGSRSEQGFAMSAMVTQRYLYQFDVRNSELSEKPVGEPKWDDNDWDWQGLAEENLSDSCDLGFEEIAPGCFEFRDYCYGYTTQVKSLDEAVEQYKKGVVAEWDLSLQFEGIEGLRSDTKAFLVKRLKNECLKHAHIPVSEAWNSRELFEAEEE
ncbi:hypothetical protein ACMXYR_14420 [Neptuniibacter sp. QD29_5]|uniref:hypothetical protein n=1 Tax=Neptuniibacter sp. QD29_5 TaxID=3398207 RepID=UPI0039F51646